MIFSKATLRFDFYCWEYGCDGFFYILSHIEIPALLFILCTAVRSAFTVLAAKVRSDFKIHDIIHGSSWKNITRAGIALTSAYIFSLRERIMDIISFTYSWFDDHWTILQLRASECNRILICTYSCDGWRPSDGSPDISAEGLRILECYMSVGVCLSIYRNIIQWYHILAHQGISGYHDNDSNQNEEKFFHRYRIND